MITPPGSAVLYCIPGSNASRTGRLLLEHKGIPYRLVVLPNELHRPILRVLGLPGRTVPAIRIDGQVLQTTLAISRGLDRLMPEPPLFPADPRKRLLVEAAERWGEEALQVPIRHLAYSKLVRRGTRADYLSYFVHPLTRVPARLAIAGERPLLKLTARRVGSTEAAVQRAIEAIPGLLDHADALIAAGTIDGAELNAADFQIAPSISMLMRFRDLRTRIEHRPVARLANRIPMDGQEPFDVRMPVDWLRNFPAL